MPVMDALPISLEKSKIVIRQHTNGRIQVVKIFDPCCIPSERVLSPSHLNSRTSKIVHSAVVKKLKPYFTEDDSFYGHESGYENLPCELLEELVSQLKHWDNSL